MTKWTDNQLEALEHNGKELIVSASAGSGKTSVMIEKVLRLLIKGVDIARVLVLTFSVASSTDMYLKLKDSIGRALENLNQSSDAFKNLKKAYNEIYNAQVSTLHAFCASTVRSYCHTLGLDNSFSISTEEDCRLRKDVALNRVLEKNIESGTEAFLTCADVLSKKRTDDNLKSVVLRLYELLSTCADAEEYIKKAQQCNYDYESVINSELRDAEEHFLQCVNLLIEENSAPALDSVLFELKIFLESGCLGLNQAKFKNVRSGSADEEFVAKVRALKTLLVNENKRLIALRGLPKDAPIMLIHEIIRLTEEFKHEYSQEKRKDNVMDFADLERFCLTLLKDKEIAKAIQDKYDYLFVDEYQDINPCQEEILNLLCASDAGRFYVGDLKQSIYGFRLCEPRLFLDRLKSYCVNGNGVFLNKNFRSGKRIIEFVNKVFSELMTEPFGGSDYRTDSLMQAGLESDSKVFLSILNLKESTLAKDEAEDFLDTDTQEYSPDDQTAQADGIESDKALNKNGQGLDSFVYSVMENAGSEGGADTAKLEGLMIASDIKRIMNDCPIICSDGQKRAVSYGDIVILFRSMTEYTETIAKTLKECGIPVVSALRQNLPENRAVCHLIDFLKVLLNPRRDMPLLGLMLSPVYGFKPRELALLRQLCPKAEHFFETAEYAVKNHYQTLKDSGVNEEIRSLSEKLNTMYAELEYYRNLAKQLPIIKVLTTFLADKDYRNVLGASAYDVDAWDCVCRFLDIVSASNYSDLSSFMFYLDALDERIDYTPETLLNTDAVRIMTIHKSKGLEFPVVVLAGLSRQFSNESLRQNVLIDRDFGIGLMTYDLKLRSKDDNLPRSAIALALKRRERCEELRLLYVAMTRAKNVLVLSVCQDMNQNAPVMSAYTMLKAKGFGEWLRAVLSPSLFQNTFSDGGLLYEQNIYSPSDFDGIEGGESFVPLLSKGSKAIEETLEKRHSFCRLIPQGKKNKKTVTELNASEYEGEVYTRDYALNSSEAFFDAERAIEKGNAYHKVMQFIDFEANTQKKVLSELDRLLSERFITPTESGLVSAERIANALNSDVFSDKHKKKFYREKGFLFYFNENAEASVKNKSASCITDSETLVQGIVDLIIISDGAITVLDYKTSKGTDDAIIKQYAKQMQIYAVALEQVLGLPVKEKLIWSFEHNSLIKL